MLTRTTTTAGCDGCLARSKAASIKHATDKAAELAKQAHELKAAAAAEEKLDQVFGFDADGPAQR